MQVIIFEDAAVANLEPLSLTRPVFDLRCGAGTLLQRQLAYCGQQEVSVIVRPALAELCRRVCPGLMVNEAVPTDDDAIMLVNARWLPPSAERLDAGAAQVGLVGEEVAYVRLTPKRSALDVGRLESQLAEWKRNLPHRQVGGRLMSYPWDLIEHNAAALQQDAQLWRRDRNVGPQPTATVVGSRDDFLCQASARIEPHVLVDTTHGPVLVDSGAVVQAFSRLEGPCYVGPETYHDGFLGHSYLGEWVNFGAGTHTSDLRTDYGLITMPINGRSVDSGLMKVGAYVGDHTRTSIATLLNTGTVIGPFGLLIASGSLLPRLIPPFARYGHGRIQERTDLGQMFAAAATAMARRGQEWSEAHAEFYLSLFDATAESRRQIIRESDQRRLRRVVG
jgi:hypothetical protein